jgi:hypothetical protein
MVASALFKVSKTDHSVHVICKVFFCVPLTTGKKCVLVLNMDQKFYSVI